MKIVVLLVLGMLSGYSLFAQKTEERAALVANKFCQCVQNTYSNIDEDVKQSMGKMVSYKLQNQPQDLERYMKRLPAELVIRIQEQAATFQKNGALAQYCIHDMERAMKNISLEDPAYEEMTKERFSRLIQKQLKQQESCEFAALLLELGLRENTKKPQVRIGQLRSGETASK